MGKLVAYSGFSSTNYLEAPYNSDLDFGTGDFCVMGWVKTAASTVEIIFDTRDSSGSSEGFYGFLNGSGQVVFGTRTGSAKSENTYGSVPSNSWSFVTCVVSSTGTLHSVYIDGILSGSNSVTARSIGGTDSPLNIGISSALTAPFTGSLALLRISATASTAEQISKIYEDEKFLFQENAQATLFGTSDAVTALAHDPVTDLLHVGTSAGRSVFDGLRRVENTTTAVGTAISASNSLIAED